MTHKSNTPAANTAPMTGPATDPVLRQPPCALVMAGGTGGHIFPGLALAQALREAGWRVVWLGGSGPTMESRLVPPQGFEFESIDFSAWRGQRGLLAHCALPWRLLRALWQSAAVLRRVRPQVVLGLGGYISVPAGVVAALSARWSVRPRERVARIARAPALIVHEQNAVAGWANRVLARWADRVFTAFPGVLPRGEWVGNPLRAAFLQQALPAQRFAARTGPLRVLVVGGSLGAQALNDVLPQALALLAEQERPIVTHQSGEKQWARLQDNYARAGVAATLVPFIADTAAAFAEADLVIARAGAGTVCEIAAVGAAALLLPFPHAVDDHQTRNARHLADAGAAWLMPQGECDAPTLAGFLRGLGTPPDEGRKTLLHKAQRARALAQTRAVSLVLAACETYRERFWA